MDDHGPNDASPRVLLDSTIVLIPIYVRKDSGRAWTRRVVQ